ncbi:uncharacterized protein LOC119685281 [Teleopsis dalmanni]|uniref:uncharacterized protein LOC119685281 n=1 Tax=Teleopsis dalmanni TaxID=139649 RepID=UPI0018CE8E37|nr:uncharacterized protein LOC119685281 [Teleopsis dalmanni]XP_037955449.1 uncharacterized protein LOC119685281 [Teleopsis dalmanni]XP_037955450.1 uncharacterized protein LOC119685281 [Teleopsis dalmanni]XP_037955451.1 uncharacterized protein LOC119685281 [Teleopsis dalmanni]
MFRKFVSFFPTLLKSFNATATKNLEYKIKEQRLEKDESIDNICKKLEEPKRPNFRTSRNIKTSDKNYDYNIRMDDKYNYNTGGYQKCVNPLKKCIGNTSNNDSGKIELKRPTERSMVMSSYYEAIRRSQEITNQIISAQHSAINNKYASQRDKDHDSAKQNCKDSIERYSLKDNDCQANRVKFPFLIDND